MSTDWPPEKPLNHPVRLAVLISGGGTTLLNLLDWIEAGKLNAEVVLAVADRECSGIERLKARGIACPIVSRKEFSTPEAIGSKTFELCRAANADLVILGGYLSLIQIPDDFDFRVMNIHPSLIPSFCGKGFYGGLVHAAAIDRGVRVSGCTVHFANNEFDQGPIILQKTVPVLNDDTPSTLAARVFTAECEAYPEAIAHFADGRLKLVDGRLHVLNQPDAGEPG